MKPSIRIIHCILLLFISDFTRTSGFFLKRSAAPSSQASCQHAILSIRRLVSSPKSSSTQDTALNEYNIACRDECKSFIGGDPLVNAYCNTRKTIEENAFSLGKNRRLASFESHPCASMDQWNSSRIEKYILANSDNITAAVLNSHAVDGFTLSHITASELIDMGVKAGKAYQLLKAVSEDKVSILEHSLPALDPCSILYQDTEDRGAVTININIEKILSVNELDYEFTAMMWVFVAYLDDRSDVMPRMFGPCDEPALNLAQSRKCADDMLLKSEFPFFFTNQKGSSEMVASQRWMFEFGGYPVGYYVGIHYLQATFNNELSFVDFPFDSQNLRIIIRAPWDQDIGIKLDSFDLSTWTSPGWKVDSISSRAEVQQGLDKWKMSPSHFNWDWFSSSTQTQGGWDYSAQVLTMKVSRESEFYVLNMIIPIWLLMILSWSAFFMDPESIDGRMGMVLTIMLGFIAFQFVVNDNMPKSGESSRLHEFMALASTTISFVGFESVLVYKLHQNSEAYKIFLHSTGIWNYICVHLHFYDDEWTDDDESAGEEIDAHRHVGLVDTLSVLLVPNVFSIRTYNIMQDDMSLGCMITCLTCTLGYVVGNFAFEQWDHNRKVAKRRHALEMNDDLTEGKII